MAGVPWEAYWKTNQQFISEESRAVPEPRSISGSKHIQLTSCAVLVVVILVWTTLQNTFIIIIIISFYFSVVVVVKWPTRFELYSRKKPWREDPKAQSPMSLWLSTVPVIMSLFCQDLFFCSSPRQSHPFIQPRCRGGQGRSFEVNEGQLPSSCFREGLQCRLGQTWACPNSRASLEGHCHL